MTRWNEAYCERVQRFGVHPTEHARQRMDERGITEGHVKQVIESGAYELQENRVVRYSFQDDQVSAEALALAQSAGIADVVVVVSQKNGGIVTVFRQ